MSAVRASPLTVTGSMFIATWSLFALFPAASDSGMERPLGELTGEVALVLGRPTLIGARAAVLGGLRGSGGDRLVRDWLAAQGVLGGGGAELLRTDGGEADADLADRVTVEPHTCPGGGDGPVSGAPLDLAVGRPASRPDRRRGSR